jgi:hypothetical protein
LHVVTGGISTTRMGGRRVGAGDDQLASDEEREAESRATERLTSFSDAVVARQRYLSMAGFGLSIPLFFVTTYAWLLWIIVPPLAGWVGRLWHRDGHGPGAGQAAGLSAAWLMSPPATPPRLVGRPPAARAPREHPAAPWQA